MKIYPWLIAGSLAAASCGGDPAPQPVAPASQPTTAAPAPATATAEPATPATPLAIPESGDPANHYLDGETLFISQQAYRSNFTYASPAKLLAPAGQDGKSTFWNFNTKKEDRTQHFWKSRAAKPEELAVGPLALIAHKKGPQGIYVGPSSVKEAYEMRWWITRIVSVRPQSEGYVLLASGYRAAPSAIRFLEGDQSPTIRQQGKEDAHFLASEHWFVGRGPLPERNHVYLDPAVPAKPDAPMAGGEGRFVLTDSGAILLTAHAWQTRMATRADLKKGQLVIAPNIKQGKTYRAPKTRAEALSTRWWAVKILDTKNLGSGTVTVEGPYEVATDALRIVSEG